MRSGPCRCPGFARRGFTLIEVIGALVIFSGGVLMVLQLTTALTRQMEYSAKTSEIVTRTQERIDSLEALPFTSLSLGVQQDTLTIRGTSYSLTERVSQVTAVLYEMEVTMAPVTAGEGPTFSTTSYAAAEW